MLPKIELPTDVVDLHGTKVEVRGLSRSEFLHMAKEAEGDVETAEILALAAGAGCTVEEAKEWRENSPSGDVGKVLDRISELSGMSAEQQGK